MTAGKDGVSEQRWIFVSYLHFLDLLQVKKPHPQIKTAFGAVHMALILYITGTRQGTAK